jgi:hypothetical protein
VSAALRRAAAARHDAARERAQQALHELSTQGQPVNFRAVARAAGVSTDFLYGQPDLRDRITQLRTTRGVVADPTGPRDAAWAGDHQPSSTSAAVRALSAQLKQLRTLHARETQRLHDALATAQGENLELRRRLARHEP